MFKILTLNSISPTGISLFPKENYRISDQESSPDGIILRSYKMHDMELPPSVLAVARAGAGTNNIPSKDYAEKGVVVFNSPGANANGVKELAILGLLLASRDVHRGINWIQGLKGKGDEVPKLVEKGKGEFGGQEIRGKRLGVIGLGAIGVMTANDALALGMDVTGYDPFISVEAAWGLSSSIKKAGTLEELYRESDYLTLHIPLTEATRELINEKALSCMKPGVRLLNFSRGELVNDAALLKAIASGQVARYVTDFAGEALLGQPNIIPIPHLGASTWESEDNCAAMVVRQLRDYLERGNIRNSVNFPNCEMPFSGNHRILVPGRNIPGILSSITAFIGDQGINVSGMINNSLGDYAYTIVDVEDEISPEVLGKIKRIDGILGARVITIK
ncbi:MAG: 3-phosphoglycerate dehydrogenase [Spirochaetales bacterium]|jgi:D-3-phosphoglycerate dehydrogenase|nr:3-phosphoglycerate dehydrogenase [Spirochaetales bacterium]